MSYYYGGKSGGTNVGPGFLPSKEELREEKLEKQIDRLKAENARLRKVEQLAAEAMDFCFELAPDGCPYYLELGRRLEAALDEDKGEKK